MEKKKLGELEPGVEQRALYHRKGKTYRMLNKEWQVEVEIKNDGSVIGRGTTEPVDPNEEVEVIQDGLVKRGGTEGSGWRHSENEFH